MTDDTNSRTASSDADGPGIQLRRAREARGMGIGDIAQELHLDTWIIEALEEDDFAALGAPVFAKGHMRQYGALMGLPTDDLMIAYYRVRGRDDAPPAPITATMSRHRGNPNRIWAAIVLAVLVLGALAALLWFMTDRTQTSTVSQGPGSLNSESLSSAITSTPALPESAIALADGGPSQVSDTPVETSGEAVTSAAEEPVADASEVATTPGPVAVGDLVPGDTFELTLKFSEQSWVEVSDGNGQLIYGIYEAGSERSVSATAPVELYFGLARGVDVTVNGQAFPIPADSLRRNTARFVIGNDS